MNRAAFADGHVFSGSTISEVWGRALFELAKPGARGERSPLLFVIDGAPEAGEILPIRDALDAYLESESETSVEDVASTVFPSSLWRLHGHKGRAEFFAAYRRAIPWLRRGSKKARKANQRGIYFARMVAFNDGATTDAVQARTPPNDGNQLETVLQLVEEVRAGRRQSVQRIKLQVGIFDPVRDHTSQPYLPFPCLQHLTFEPDMKAGVLHTNAFYATQQLIRKAYGNLLGLHQLGLFMASEMRLRPGRLSVFVGVEKLGVAKRGLASLIETVEKSRVRVAA